MFRKWIISFFGVLAFSACTTKELTAPCPDPVVSVALAPDTIYVGQSKTMAATWLPQGAEVTSVTWSSASPSIATVSSTGTITGVAVGETNVTVKVTCCNGTISKEASAKVVVRARPVPPEAPTVTLSADPSQIVVGSTSKIKWSSTGTTACTRSAVPAISAWSGASATSGSQDLSGLAIGKYDITQSCTGAGGTATATVTLVVTSAPPPPIELSVRFSASKGEVVQGSEVFLSGNSSGATSCTAISSPAFSGWSGTKPLNVSEAVSFDTPVGLYTLTFRCSNGNVFASASTTVRVVEKETPPPQDGWVHSIIISPKTATLERGNTLSLAVSVEADAGITKEFTCESSNMNFIRVERKENACFLTVVESPTANTFVHVIAQTVGYAKSIDGKVLQLQAGALITVKPTPSQ